MGFGVVDSQWRTGVLTGAVVVKVLAGLDRKQRRYGLHKEVLLAQRTRRVVVPLFGHSVKLD